MTEYLSPGVYIEQVADTGGAVIRGASYSTGGFEGIAPRGAINTALLVTSWSDYITKFAYGLDTPFLANSDLSYAVYGFFQNGGKRCYVTRVAHSTAAKSSANLGVTVPITFTALEEGTWGNALKVLIEAGTVESTFTVKVYLTIDGVDTLVESFKNLSSTTTNSNYYANAINGVSKFITVSTGGTLEAVVSTSLVGGVDGISDITDSDYVSGLSAFDVCSDLNILAIPGQTSSTIVSGLTAYVENRNNVFAIFDLPSSTTPAGAKTARESMSCSYGAIYYPWIKVVDPLSLTNTLRICPPSAHVAGTYARILNNRGIHKAPAGTEALLRGAVELVTTISDSDLGTLNSNDVNCLVSKPNYGIVVWGARSISPDIKMPYVSDILLDTYIKKSVKENTQWAVFEPNDEILWKRITATVQDFLNNLWLNGSLRGAKASEAYFVQCDSEVNTDATINAGQVICKVGYAGKKPAEFVIFKFSHLISSN